MKMKYPFSVMSLDTYHKAYLTVLEMLKDRGLKLQDEAGGGGARGDGRGGKEEVKHPLSREDFVRIQPDAFRVINDPELEKDDNRLYRTGNLAYVMFLYTDFSPASKQTFPNSVYRPIYQKYKEDIGATEASYRADVHLTSFRDRGNVLVLFSNPTKKTHEYNQYLKDDFPSMEFHEIHHTVFNPTKHSLQPKFTLLAEGEQNRVKSMYRLANLPMISRKDPISRWYAAEQRDIFLIERRNGQINYRLVLG